MMGPVEADFRFEGEQPPPDPEGCRSRAWLAAAALALLVGLGALAVTDLAPPPAPEPEALVVDAVDVEDTWRWRPIDGPSGEVLGGPGGFLAAAGLASTDGVAWAPIARVGRPLPAEFGPWWASEADGVTTLTASTADIAVTVPGSVDAISVMGGRMVAVGAGHLWAGPIADGTLDSVEPPWEGAPVIAATVDWFVALVPVPGARSLRAWTSVDGLDWESGAPILGGRVGQVESLAVVGGRDAVIVRFCWGDCVTRAGDGRGAWTIPGGVIGRPMPVWDGSRWVAIDGDVLQVSEGGDAWDEVALPRSVGEAMGVASDGSRLLVAGEDGTTWVGERP